MNEAGRVGVYRLAQRRAAEGLRPALRFSSRSRHWQTLSTANGRLGTRDVTCTSVSAMRSLSAKSSVKWNSALARRTIWRRDWASGLAVVAAPPAQKHSLWKPWLELPIRQPDPRQRRRGTPHEGQRQGRPAPE